MDKNFNIILTGVGGQGIITLLQIIDQAGFVEGYDVKSSELHGLSQRGGSVEAHIRFGKKVLSPMVSNGSIDLIMALESLEGLRESVKAGKETKILANKNFMVFGEYPKQEEIINKLQEFKNNFYLVSGNEICKEKLQNEAVAGVYLLGYAVNKNLIPLKKESVIKAIENVIPEKYQEINIKAFNLAYDN
jgi:indolepyruvate ferredoxin oxidoreductase beta subunit